MYYFQNESECFIGVSKHRETNESTRPQAKCFYCFEVFGYPDKTRSISFGNNLLLVDRQVTDSLPTVNQQVTDRLRIKENCGKHGQLT